ncbi:hypothetical protein LUW75_24070 [Streptomyces sp. MRC013]|uniref:hypothetical protein n=1 Tax=Streptomyces sp. MRC013 TaxID=2898276 RepID=UPI002027175D|nr:hypothetical protein [Streptomyces sp. MRC013]URM92522.1 hypothetical protein LUW75_24070 [Streptomyces sp. MRC013]
MSTANQPSTPTRPRATHCRWATSGSAGGQRTYTYNGAIPTCGKFQGRHCTSKDASGKTTSFTCDTEGDPTKVTPPATACPGGTTQSTI